MDQLLSFFVIPKPLNSLLLSHSADNTASYFIYLFQRFHLSLWQTRRERAQAKGAVGRGRSQLPADQAPPLPTLIKEMGVIRKEFSPFLFTHLLITGLISFSVLLANRHPSILAPNLGFPWLDEPSFSHTYIPFHCTGFSLSFICSFRK